VGDGHGAVRLGNTSVGVVSGKGRITLGQQGTGVDMIPTDAAPSPGNSGAL
jgi:S1-C subfamily serine protease